MNAMHYATGCELDPRLNAGSAGPDPSAARAKPAHPDLAQVLRACGPIPRGAAFLGVALDGLPVLLNLRDAAPGPILLVGDPGCGKRRLLQVIARAADFIHPVGEVSHVVLTDHAREWEAYALSSNCEGILPFHHPLTLNYIRSLADMARTSASLGRYLLLIIDGLEALANDRDLAPDMHWLLQAGLSQFIWPIASINTPGRRGLAEWIKPFHTVLCGRSSTAGYSLLDPQTTSRPSLPATGEPQFALLTGNDWLPFWVPEPL